MGDEVALRLERALADRLDAAVWTQPRNQRQHVAHLAPQLVPPLQTQTELLKQSRPPDVTSDDVR